MKPLSSGKYILGILVVLAAVAGAMQLYLDSAEKTLTVKEARQTFEQLGCTSCHVEGGVAEPWDEMLDEIAFWARNFETLDEAVRSEVVYLGGKKFNSFNELMEQMRKNVRASQDDIAPLTQFYLDYFEQNKATATTTTTGQPQQPAQPSGDTGMSRDVVLAVVGSALLVVIAVIAVGLKRR